MCYFCAKIKGLQRYFLEIAYRGTKYHGWQRQLGAVSVQQRLEESLETLLRHPVMCMGCGRTDTGVHASQFFLHFDAMNELEPEKLVYRLNGMLENDIAVRRCIPVEKEAHARFDATKRTYRYFIHQEKDPFRGDHSTFIPVPLDVDRMNEAAAKLIEMENFKSFARLHTDVRNFNCMVTTSEWKTDGPLLTFEISSNRFLRNMVRAVVGTLLEVGRERITLKDFMAIAESKDRSKAGKSVPARGLFLCEVKYPYIQ